MLDSDRPAGNRFGAKPGRDVAECRKRGGEAPNCGGMANRPNNSKIYLVIFRAVRWIPAALALALVIAPAARVAWAQVIEYENNGQKYQTLTRKGLTVIVTHMPNHVAGFGLMQVSIANGSGIYWTVQPEEFSYIRQGVPMNAISANQVVDMLLEKGSHADVVKLVTSYENTLYGIPNMRSTNGYEQRRRGAMSQGVSAKLEAAATASAIALAQVRIAPGQSTDGAVFIPLTHELKTLAGGHLVFKAEGETFEFHPD